MEAPSAALPRYPTREGAGVRDQMDERLKGGRAEPAAR